MRWLISSIGSREELNGLTNTVRRSYMSPSIVKMVDIFEDNYNKSPAIFYGSINACNKIFQDNPDWPCFYFPEKMTCQYYYSHWNGLLINRHYSMMPISEFFSRIVEVFDSYGEVHNGLTDDINPITELAVFVRPNSNDKIFTGRPVFKSQVHSFKRHIEMLDLPLETLIVVAQPVKILEEYRCVIHHNKFVTGSKYYVFDELEGHLPEYGEVPADVIEFAESVPHLEGLPIYVLDVGRTEQGLGILEMGSVHCTGFYEMDLQKFVSAVGGEVMSKWGWLD